MARSRSWPAGPTEGAAGQVFLVAGLFADHHDAGVRRSLAEHDLGRGLPQLAAAARLGLAGGGYERRRLAPRVWFGGFGRSGAGGFRGRDHGWSTIFSTRAPAVRISSGMAAASGRFFQYLRGISDVMAPILRRAGLKMEL